MKETKTNHLLEYLSLTLILSYFFIHNIFLVLIGIIFSLYLININFIKIFIRSFDKSLFIKKASKKFNKNNKAMELDSIDIKARKDDSNLTLVETIEEFGVIPSIDKNNNSNAA